MRGNEDPIETARIESASDRLIDLLLAEQLGDQRPPDLSAQILARLNESVTADRRVSLGSNNSLGNPSGRRREASRLLAIAASIAAFIATGAVAYYSVQRANQGVARTPNIDKLPPFEVATADGGDSNDPRSAAADKIAAAESTTKSNNQPRAADKPDTANPPKPQRELLAGPDFQFPANPADTIAAAPVNTNSPPAIQAKAPEAPAAIVGYINQQFDELWRAAGFVDRKNRNPETQTSLDTNGVQTRLVSQALREPSSLAANAGNQNSSTHAIGPQTLATIRLHADDLARRWLEQILSADAWRRLNPEQQQALVAQVAASFRGETTWDEVARNWVAAPVSSAAGAETSSAANDQSVFLVALGSPQGVELVDQVGRTVLDEDLTCARCHDHPLKARLSQREYWGLAAVFQSELRWVDRDGHRVIEAIPGDAPRAKLFFETRDGRSRLALPQLLATQEPFAAGQQASRATFVDSAMRSGVFARATINRLWQLAFNRPLVGSVADPDAPPADAHLENIQQRLSEQLVAHKYDLGQALDWIVNSKPFAATADESQPEPTMNLAARELRDRKLRWFYQFAPSQPVSDAGTLLALAKRWTAPDYRIGEAGVLAQANIDGSPRNNAANNGSGNKPADRQALLVAALRASFPMQKSELPASWLGSIKDYDEQARHLMYVAGLAGQPNVMSNGRANCAKPTRKTPTPPSINSGGCSATAL